MLDDGVADTSGVPDAEGDTLYVGVCDKELDGDTDVDGVAVCDDEGDNVPLGVLEIVGEEEFVPEGLRDNDGDDTGLGVAVGSSVGLAEGIVVLLSDEE